MTLNTMLCSSNWTPLWRNAIAPLEKAFTHTEDPELQAYVAEVLKNIYFRFRDRSDEYRANYEKYNSFFG